ncbi:MAG TPA: replication-relaxation family protein [Solirubrobacterales bacterium]|nr:replication-relaxation family protein [Solirubrobacterales bacterium]
MSGSASLESAATEMGIEIVASLAQHRVLSAAQVRAIHLPASGERWAQRMLVRLGNVGLAGYVRSPRSHRRLWHVTELGANVAREAGALDGEPRLIGAEGAAGPLQAHTLAVNDATICFLEAARERGDEFGPFSWRHEVSHPLSRGRGRRRRALVADAVFTYLLLDGEGVAIEQRFLELDRATLSVDRLAAELARYAELHRLSGADGEPRWRERYPVFPPVHCVLTGGRRAVLERRRATTIAMLGTNPRFTREPEVAVSICLLEDLEREGPFAPIFRDASDPARPVDWLGGDPDA